MNDDFTRYVFIDRFSGSWAFVTINKFVSNTGTFVVTVLNPTASDITQTNALFIYDWIKFCY